MSERRRLLTENCGMIASCLLYVADHTKDAQEPKKSCLVIYWAWIIVHAEDAVIRADTRATGCNFLVVPGEGGACARCASLVSDPLGGGLQLGIQADYRVGCTPECC